MIKIYQRLISLVLAGTLSCVLVGCNKRKKFVLINPTSTIGITLDAISSYSKMDDILVKSNPVCVENNRELSFNDLLNEYNNARICDDEKRCNEMLYLIGRVMLQATIAEQLNVDYNDITSMNVYYGYNSTLLDYIPVVKTDVSYVNEGDEQNVQLDLYGKAETLGINVMRASVGNLKLSSENILSTIDAVYDSYIEFLLTTSVMKKYGNDNGQFGKLSSELSQQKIDEYQEYVKKLTS